MSRTIKGLLLTVVIAAAGFILFKASVSDYSEVPNEPDVIEVVSMK